MGEPREVTVAKIGHKWITLEGRRPIRIDRKTMYADGGVYTSPGRCYLSKAEYEAEERRRDRWRLIANRAGNIWNKPDHITDADLDDLERILRVECTDRH
jgi:hypothetical protein